MDKSWYIFAALKPKYIRSAILLNCILFTLISNITKAQDQSPRIKYFTTEDGLSQGTINDLLKDSSGFIWIATEDGLNRFDGKEFKHFKYSESDSTSISGNVLNKLCEDEKGNIWVGTIGNGLNYYDKNLDAFKRIKLEYASNTETISDILVADNGIVWVTTRTSGLHRLQPTSDGFFLQKNFLSNKRLGAISIDKDGKLWIGSFDGKVYTLELSDNDSLQADTELQIEGYVQAFYHSERLLLIGCDFGLYIYDKHSRQARLFEPEKEDNHPTKHVVTFLKENGSQVWVGTGNGMYLLELSNLTMNKKITYNEDGLGGLTTSTVQALLRLSPNQIFVGTSGFLNLLDFNEPYFKNISKNRLGQQLLNDNVVYSVLNDGQDLWLGTTDGGLNLIRNGKSYYFLEDIDDPESISGSAVLDITKDHKNNRLWLATTRGLSMIDLMNFDPNHPKFTVFHHDTDNTHSINMDYVTSVTLDKNNNLWGATHGSGIFRLEISMDSKPRFIRYKNQVGNNNSLINDFITCLRADTDNTIWVGSEGGLTALKFLSNGYEQPNFTNHVRNPDKKKSLSHNSIVDILIDAEQRIWIGTRHGLNLFLGNNEFESWTEQDQFPNAVVFNLQDDEAGNLWLATNDGIIKFDPENTTFKRYGLEDGIQGTEFNIGASFRDERGNIYLGGVNGLTYFHPDDLEKKIDEPQPIYFSQLRIKDEIFDTRNPSKNLFEKSLLQTDQLEIRHNQFPFYLQFSSIDFRMNKSVQYGYKLLPKDEGYYMLSDPEIQFLNLPSGSYTLQVNGFSRGKEWEQVPLEMKLEILPPWWATWWAYAIYLAIAAALGYYFYRFKLSRKLADAESVRIKEVSELKSGLYTNITHEFRTPLTVILGMTDSLESELRTIMNPPIKNAIEMIRRNGRNLLSLVNEMLDLSKLESGHMETNLMQINVVPFIKYLGESFHSFAENDDIHFTVYSEIDELMMDVDSQKLSTIISNLLSNAIKFTPPLGKIVLHVQNENDTKLVIKITDTGMGISKEELPHIFNRFYQTDATTTRKRDGTGIGLSLTKELVNLLGGQISVQSTPAEGSIFKVELPITQNAPKASVESLKLRHKSASQFAVPEFQENLFLENDEESPLVLIIEDNKDVAYYLNQCLRGRYKTIHAINGIEGLEMAFEHIPDIIISDVMMPGKDGYEVCSMLKQDERTDHIPIVLLTAKVTTKDRVLGLTQGADAYLAKPFIKEELFARLEQLLFLRKKLIAKFQQGQFSKVMAKQPKNAETKFIAKIIELIHDALDNSTFGVSELSLKLGLSESQVYRKLKAITGKSTAVFIRTIRLEAAKEQLQDTDKTVSEIAYAVGFNDPSWFSRAFKEEFGLTPSDIHK